MRTGVKALASCSPGSDCLSLIHRTRIAAQVARVFDAVADSCNEPSFNPAMTDVELLTPLPIGSGTRFRAHMWKSPTWTSSSRRWSPQRRRTRCLNRGAEGGT